MKKSHPVQIERGVVFFMCRELEMNQHRTQVAGMLELLGKGLPMALSPFVWDNTLRAAQP